MAVVVALAIVEVLEEKVAEVEEEVGVTRVDIVTRTISIGSHQTAMERLVSQRMGAATAVADPTWSPLAQNPW